MREERSIQEELDNAGNMDSWQQHLEECRRWGGTEETSSGEPLDLVSHQKVAYDHVEGQTCRYVWRRLTRSGSTGKGQKQPDNVD